MFTTSVANIGPRDEIVIAIEYQETVRYDEGTFRLRFPMAITPRYTPGAGESRCHAWRQRTRRHAGRRAQRRLRPAGARHDRPRHGRCPVRAVEHVPPDEHRAARRPSLSPHAAGRAGAGGPRLRARVDAGCRRRTRNRTVHRDEGRQDVRAADGSAADGRQVGDTPRRREVTYIIDTSGSMEGVSMAQARDALAMALDRLQPGDRFNVIEFNSTTHSLFAAPVGVDAVTLQRARQFVSGLRARGGTEMLPALEIALAGPPQCVDPAPGRVPDRRRGRQRGRDPQARRRAHRRPPPVHGRHRPRAQHVLHDQGRAVRARHVHRDRRRARSAGEDDRALPQARIACADRHQRRVAGGRGRVAARRAGPVRGRAGHRERERSTPNAATRQHRGVGAARGCDVGHAAAEVVRCERKRRRRAVGTRQDRRAHGRRPARGARAGHPHGGDRRGAHASSRQQVHEPRRGRRDADEARRASRRPKPRCPAIFPKASPASTSCRAPRRRRRS